jgi:hypothetical protein
VLRTTQELLKPASGCAAANADVPYTDPPSWFARRRIIGLVRIDDISREPMSAPGVRRDKAALSGTSE